MQIDDAYLGGEQAGKRGPGSENKVSFVMAVQTTEARAAVGCGATREDRGGKWLGAALAWLPAFAATRASAGLMGNRS